MDKPVCAIAGVGPANGASFARKFSAAGYAVALMARSADYVTALAGELDDARGYGCDMRDAEAITATCARIREQMGPVDTLVYNAGSGLFGNIDTVSVAEFEDAWRSNTLGCLVSAQNVIPDMRSAGHGNIIVIGATASVRGGADFLAFASAKAAQRSLAQSMARLLGTEGIHVGYVIIDGVIDTERARAMEFFSDKPDDYFLQADDIAEAVYYMTQQQRSAWTFELDVRPFGESW
jgi:NADP-dependent 3-hydroxy acid dehydrogenase YdfG